MRFSRHYIGRRSGSQHKSSGEAKVNLDQGQNQTDHIALSTMSIEDTSGLWRNLVWVGIDSEMEGDSGDARVPCEE